MRFVIRNGRRALYWMNYNIPVIVQTSFFHLLNRLNLRSASLLSPSTLRNAISLDLQLLHVLLIVLTFDFFVCFFASGNRLWPLPFFDQLLGFAPSQSIIFQITQFRTSICGIVFRRHMLNRTVLLISFRLFSTNHSCIYVLFFNPI